MPTSAERRGTDHAPHPSPPLDTNRRLLSLDVFRGATVAAMILVNNPGSWSHVYPPLAHAEWHGWTPTDLIFPFFLFIAGVAIPLALDKRVQRGDARKLLLRKVLQRGVLIFAVGLFLNGFPDGYLNNLRIPGVLQRIAIAYVVSATAYMFLPWRVLLGMCATILVGYWMAMTMIPLPNGVPANLEPGTNLAAWIDGKLLAGHMWSSTKTWDPEGALSTLPAVVTCCLGLLTGIWISRQHRMAERLTGMFGMGVACAIVGTIWSWWFPINKALWTSSFVMLTGGLALQCLALSMWLIDHLGWRRGISPWLAFGSNALAVFVASGMIGRLLLRIKVTEEAISLKSWLVDHAFARLLPAESFSPNVVSLLYAVANVLIFLPPLLWMYRRKIFVRL
ncbi:MAG: DUF5009 domain-containing protein [Pirellulaceae bacterium]|nr:DUF5009 domain-containing protein [Planctomycetales bacterium]